MSNKDLDFSDFENVQKDLEAFKEDAIKNETLRVQLAANTYVNDVRNNTSPVFWYDTGTLRRSIHVETLMEGSAPVALVGTDVPYARRLEYGFMDRKDSLGRLYHQAAKPIWRPVWNKNLRKYEAMMAKDFEDAKWERT